MIQLFVYPLIPAVLLGILNYLYWKRQGRAGIQQLILGFMLFYAAGFLMAKYILVD